MACLASCTEVEDERSVTFLGGEPVVTNSGGNRSAEVAVEGRPPGFLQFFRRSSKDRPVNEQALNAPVQQELKIEKVPNGEFSVSLVDVPVAQAARAVLGETLGLSFSIDPAATGTVTLLATRPMSGDKVLAAFRGALELNGLEVMLQDETYVIQPSGPEFARVRGFPAEGDTSNIVYAFPLEFISVDEMVRILQPLASPSSNFVPLQNRNILLASGSQSDIEAILDAVNVFDIDTLSGKSVSLVSNLTVDPVEIVQQLDAIFETGPGQSLNGVVSFIPSQNLNSVLIISKQQRYIAEAEDWIRNFSGAGAIGTQTAVVYNLNNRTAQELAPILEELLSFGPIGVEGQATNPNEPTARIIADDAGNSILAYATASEHQAIKALIHRLDSVANQVLIEATIAEVSLKDELSFGVRSFLEDGDFAISFSGIGQAALNPGAVAPGFNAIFADGTASIALNALATITDVKIVSSPSLLVLDNRQAELNVGQKVPIAVRSSQSVTDPEAPIVSEIQQENTGVNLRIRPRVGNSGRVSLDIRQEVSEAVATSTSGLESPTITQRIVNTSVAVQDGQSLVLGGLIQSSDEDTNNKVPLLGDIPVAGALFRNTDNKEERTELLIIITPRVIRDPEQARRVTDEFRSKLSDDIDQVRGPNPTTKHQLNRIFY